MQYRERMNDLATRVLEHVERGTTDQAPGFYEIDASVYADAARYEVELERIFRAVPLLLGFTAELPKPGDFKTIDIARVPVLITRSDDGVVRAFLNACRHRGLPVTEAKCGSASRFSCLYHGWTYRNDGRLLGVTEPQRFGEVDMASRGLIALPCEERAGLIFGVLSPGAPLDLDRFYGDMLEHLAHYGFEKWHLMSKVEIKGPNWKIAFDGYLETYHFPTAHRDSIASFSMSGRSAYNSYGPHIHMAGGMPSVAALRDVPADQRWTRETHEFSVLNLLFPNVSFSLGYGGVGQVAQILPGPTVGENTTILHHICREPPVDEDERSKREKMRDLIVDVLRDEDYGMGMRLQRGVEAPLPLKLIFGRNEPGNQHFHKWVEHYVSPQPAGAEPGPILAPYL